VGFPFFLLETIARRMASVGMVIKANNRITAEATDQQRIPLRPPWWRLREVV
jgi:hypothetical protein